MDATILISTVAVWLTTENTFGIVVFRASLKSLLFKNRSMVVWLSCSHSLISIVRLLVWVV